MGRQIIKQPNGKYAEFTSFSDTLCVLDATAEELVEMHAQDAAEEARRRTREIIAEIDAGKRAYHQFTMTWAEAVESDRKNRVAHKMPSPEFEKLRDEIAATGATS